MNVFDLLIYAVDSNSRNMMPTSIHGQITIEKTPSYMVTSQAPERVHEMDKKMKIIVVLKDPVERAISDFTQSRTKVGCNYAEIYCHCFNYYHHHYASYSYSTVVGWLLSRRFVKVTQTIY